jgi:hypothetical protein
MDAEILICPKPMVQLANKYPPLILEIDLYVNFEK